MQAAVVLVVTVEMDIPGQLQVMYMAAEAAALDQPPVRLQVLVEQVVAELE
jgi:hypothetical protein